MMHLHMKCFLVMPPPILIVIIPTDDTRRDILEVDCFLIKIRESTESFLSFENLIRIEQQEASQHKATSNEK